jgi:hypothetical protein
MLRDRIPLNGPLQIAAASYRDFQRWCECVLRRQQYPGFRIIAVSWDADRQCSVVRYEGLAKSEPQLQVTVEAISRMVSLRSRRMTTEKTDLGR